MARGAKPVVLLLSPAPKRGMGSTLTTLRPFETACMGILLSSAALSCTDNAGPVTSAEAIEPATGDAPMPCGWLPSGADAGEPSGTRDELCRWALGADAIAVVRVERLRPYTGATSLKNSAPGAETELVDCAGGAVGPAWVLEVTPTECLIGDCPVGVIDVHFGYGHEMSPAPAVLPDGTLHWYDNQRDVNVLPVGSFVGLALRQDAATQFWSMYGMGPFGWDAEGRVTFDDSSPSAPPDVVPGIELSELLGALQKCNADATDAERGAAREARETATGNAYFTYAALCSFEGN